MARRDEILRTLNNVAEFNDDAQDAVVQIGSSHAKHTDALKVVKTGINAVETKPKTLAEFIDAYKAVRETL